MASKNPLYTVSRCRIKDAKLYGPIHGSNNSNQTLCGQCIDQYWWIIDNNYSGKMSCKKCLTAQKILSLKASKENP
jgi:hypothetical protein